MSSVAHPYLVGRKVACVALLLATLAASACGDATKPATDDISVSLDVVPATIETGSVQTIGATVRGTFASGTPVSWRSEDLTIATVADGILTGIAAGVAHITVRAGSATTTATLTVVAAPTTRDICGTTGSLITMVVDEKLSPAINPSLLLFERDLCQDGFVVVERRAAMPDPPTLRAYLRGQYVRVSKSMAGAIIVGDLPRVYQEVTAASANPTIQSTVEEVLSTQYYTDIDGRFSASSGYRSRGNHPFSFDVHSGDLAWEIWMGLFPLDHGSYAATEAALQRYVAKNHAYRAGQLKLPRALVEVDEFNETANAGAAFQSLNLMRNGPYSWTPFSNDATANLFVSTPGRAPANEPGYQALINGLGDFFVGDAHGSWQSHGKLSLDWVNLNPINTIFFWSNGCGVGDLDHPDNFLSAVLYSTTSSVLVAKGTTNNSGGMGNNQEGFFGANIARRMTGGASLGDAVRGHASLPLIQPWLNSREYHMGTSIILGDPTLRLRQATSTP